MSSEVENQEGKLQNFIMEIKKLKETLPSLFAIENVNDLGLEENRVWEEYKSLFKKTWAELSGLDMRDKTVLDDLVKEVNALVKFIREIISGKKNKNKFEFLAWINNRLSVLGSSLQFLQGEGEDGGALQEVKEDLSKEKADLLF